jgi:hypothetical protein
MYRDTITRVILPNPCVAVDAYGGKVPRAYRCLDLRTPGEIDHLHMHEIGPSRHRDTEIATPIGDCRSSRVAILIEHQNRRVRKRPRTGDAGAADRCGGAFNNMSHNARSIARCSYLGPNRGTPDSHKT